MSAVPPTSHTETLPLVRSLSAPKGPSHRSAINVRVQTAFQRISGLPRPATASSLLTRGTSLQADLPPPLKPLDHDAEHPAKAIPQLAAEAVARAHARHAKQAPSPKEPSAASSAFAGSSSDL